MKRCSCCGSWDAMCSSETAVEDCACGRCLRAALAVAKAQVKALQAEVEAARADFLPWYRAGVLDGAEAMRDRAANSIEATPVAKDPTLPLDVLALAFRDALRIVARDVRRLPLPDNLSPTQDE